MRHVLRIMWASLLALFAARAIAQEVVVSCDPSMKWAYVSESTQVDEYVVLEGGVRTKQLIITASLPTTRDPENLTAASRGRVESTTCGPFTFVLSSISASSADVASVVSVWEGGVRVLGPLALGSCAFDTPWGECPSQWATSVSLRWDEAARSSAFSLEHSFQEFRARPNKPMEPTR
jgi:hypothetical protein